MGATGLTQSTSWVYNFTTAPAVPELELICPTSVFVGLDTLKLLVTTVRLDSLRRYTIIRNRAQQQAEPRTTPMMMPVTVPLSETTLSEAPIVGKYG
jgi:hypothetical protein